jgi:alanine racemase
MKPYLKRAWAEISLPKLRKNVEIIRGLNSAGT